MPVILAEMIAAIGDASAFVWRPLAAWFVRFMSAVGITGLLSTLWAWVQQYFLLQAYKSVVTASVVAVGLGLWATFLATFNTFLIGSGIRELFSANPLSGVPAGVLYLVSYAFPLKLAFGLAASYVQWKFSYMTLAITLNRIARALVGF